MSCNVRYNIQKYNFLIKLGLVNTIETKNSEILLNQITKIIKYKNEFSTYLKYSTEISKLNQHYYILSQSIVDRIREDFNLEITFFSKYTQYFPDAICKHLMDNDFTTLKESTEGLSYNSYSYILHNDKSDVIFLQGYKVLTNIVENLLIDNSYGVDNSTIIYLTPKFN